VRKLARVPERRIVGLGGGGETDEQTDALLAEVVRLSGSSSPRILHVPTATFEKPEHVLGMYDRLRGLGEFSYLTFFPWPPAGLRELALSQDVIFVGGGNTANMLAVWRVHGFDRILREAWEAGVLLTGWSAGMICWFEAGVTDSFGPQLEGMRDGLGFLPGSACPHYDGEERRRPVYTRLVREGFPAGLAADDGVGLHFEGTELVEVVSVRPDATGYRVGPDGEQTLEARLVSAPAA
jgi:dipeptidase E